jgi:hypothetical protein
VNVRGVLDCQAAIKFPQQPLPHAAETGHGREHRQRTRKRRFY